MVNRCLHYRDTVNVTAIFPAFMLQTSMTFDENLAVISRLWTFRA